MLKINEEVGELTQAFLARSGQTRDRGKSQDDLDAKWLVWHPDRNEARG